MKLRYIICAILVFFISTNSFNASTMVYPRSEAENYGVNKHWKITDYNLDNVMNAPYVDASEKVYDFADILTSEEEEKLYNDITNYINLTNMDMVILTTNLPYVYDSENEDYAADFYDYNDFGIDFENYSGVLLLRNAYESDPYFNVYMFGEAQLYYDFDRSEEMLDAIYPYFKSHNYVPGYELFIDMYTNYFKSGIPSSKKNYYLDENGMLIEKYNPPILVALLISGVVTGIVIGIFISKNKMVKPEKKAFDYLDKNATNFTNRQDIFINSHTSSYTVSSSSSSGGGGGGSSRGSSGGGHSSGGGRHG